MRAEARGPEQVDAVVTLTPLCGGQSNYPRFKAAALQEVA